MSPEQAPNGESPKPKHTPIESVAYRLFDIIDNQTDKPLDALTAAAMKHMVTEMVILGQSEKQPEHGPQHDDLESLVASLGLDNKDETLDAISANPQPEIPNDTVDKIG